MMIERDELIDLGLNIDNLAHLIDMTLGMMPNSQSAECVFLQNHLESMRDVCEG